MGPTGNGMWNQWWAYDNVRNVNELIEKLGTSVLFTETRKTEFLFIPRIVTSEQKTV